MGLRRLRCKKEQQWSGGSARPHSTEREMMTHRVARSIAAFGFASPVLVVTETHHVA